MTKRPLIQPLVRQMTQQLPMVTFRLQTSPRAELTNSLPRASLHVAHPRRRFPNLATMVTRRTLRAVACAALLASVEVHAFYAKAPPRAAPRARPSARHMATTMSATSTRRSLASAMGVVAASLATSAANAAPVGPWALSEFLDAVEKDTVERVTFDDAGKGSS